MFAIICLFFKLASAFSSAKSRNGSRLAVNTGGKKSFKRACVNNSPEDCKKEIEMML